MFSGTPTENLKLPQWERNDHPSFMNDMNKAFQTIDAAVGSLDETTSGLPKELEQLTTVVTSNTQDITQLQSETASSAIDIVNLKAETAKIPGMQEQIAGVTEYPYRRKIINFTNPLVFTAGSVSVTVPSVYVYGHMYFYPLSYVGDMCRGAENLAVGAVRRYSAPLDDSFYSDIGIPKENVVFASICVAMVDTAQYNIVGMCSLGYDKADNVMMVNVARSAEGTIEGLFNSPAMAMGDNR